MSRTKTLKNKNAVKKTSQSGELLKKMGHEGAIGTKIAIHNSLILAVFVTVMIIIAIVALELAYMFTALTLGYNGAFTMQSTADLLTVYITIAIVCAFTCFFAFRIENLIMKAMGRRFWKYDKKADKINRGEAFNAKYGVYFKEDVINAEKKDENTNKNN